MKKTTPARIVVTRTPAINDLLQEAWMLSPELKEKISLTVHQAIAAFVRERRRYSAFASESLSPLSGNGPTIIRKPDISNFYKSIG